MDVCLLWFQVRGRMHRPSRGLQALLIAITVLGQLRAVVPATRLPSTDRSHADAAVPDANTDSKQELIKAFEASLLNMFGLKTRPKKPIGEVHIPQQMLDLYRSQMHGSEGTGSGAGAAAPSPGMDIHASPSGASANTVRSFHHDGELSHTPLSLIIMYHSFMHGGIRRRIKGIYTQLITYPYCYSEIYRPIERFFHVLKIYL